MKLLKEKQYSLLPSYFPTSLAFFLTCQPAFLEFIKYTTVRNLRKHVSLHEHALTETLGVQHKLKQPLDP